MAAGVPLKLVAVGEAGVGKTSLGIRYVHDTFDGTQSATIGAAFLTKSVTVDGREVSVQMWDTAGQERFGQLPPMYYRGANAIIAVYDITDNDSYIKALEWIKTAREHCDNENVVVGLAGNKSDYTEKRVVARSEVSQIADSYGFVFMETSAKTGVNVKNLISGVLRLALRSMPADKLEKMAPTVPTAPADEAQVATTSTPTDDDRLRSRLIAAPFTPMNDDKTVDVSKINDLYHHLSSSGVCGVWVCGTTGEGLALTLDERKAVAEAWQSSTKNTPFEVIIHVGDTVQANAIALAEHAQSIGITKIACQAPMYLRSDDPAHVASWLAGVAAAAPNCSFYYYHFPGLTHVHAPFVDVLRECSDTIPNFVGSKYTDADLFAFGVATRTFPDLDLLYAGDEYNLYALPTCPSGFVGSTYNFCGPLFVAMQTAYFNGEFDETRRLQAYVESLIDCVRKHGGMPPQKAFMEVVGLPLGPVREPLHFDDTAKAAFLSELGERGWPTSPATWTSDFFKRDVEV